VPNTIFAIPGPRARFSATTLRGISHAARAHFAPTGIAAPATFPESRITRRSRQASSSGSRRRSRPPSQHSHGESKWASQRLPSGPPQWPAVADKDAVNEACRRRGDARGHRQGTVFARAVESARTLRRL